MEIQTQLLATFCFRSFCSFIANTGMGTLLTSCHAQGYYKLSDRKSSLQCKTFIS